VSFLDRLRDWGAPATTADADRLAVKQLGGRGADLTQPRHVLHFLYFSDETDARGATKRSRAQATTLPSTSRATRPRYGPCAPRAIAWSGRRRSRLSGPGSSR
jgi:hypothetical protein